MKKVLLATTALAMTTGWAMADVTNAGSDAGATIVLEGSAEMGVFGQDFDGTDDSKSTGFGTDVDLAFIMVGQTDGGLEFGAEIAMEDDIGAGGGAADDDSEDGGATVYISGAFGRLTMGDTDGAFDWAMTEADFGASIGDVEEHAGWNGNSGLDGTYDGQIARYEYSFGDFAVAFSGELDDSTDGDPILGLGATYGTMFGGATVAFGAAVQTISGLDDVVETTLDDDENFAATIYGLSATVEMTNGILATVNYSTAEVDGFEGDDDAEHYGLAVGYRTGPLLVAMNYGHFEDWIGDRDGDDNLETFDAEGYGVLMNYDLGGGASLQAAYSHNNVQDPFNPDETDDFGTYSFGVAMSF